MWKRQHDIAVIEFNRFNVQTNVNESLNQYQKTHFKERAPRITA